jgi:hypothetical protein
LKSRRKTGIPPIIPVRIGGPKAVKDLTDVGVDAIVGWSFLRHFKFSFDSKDGIFEIESF